MIALLGIFRVIPSWCYGLLAFVVLAGAGAVYERHAGEAIVQSKWDAEKAQAALQAESLRLLNESAIRKQTDKFIVKQAAAKVVYKTITKEVEKYVPNSLALLPPGFRLLHDAAAEGVAIDDSSGANAAPVSPNQVINTVANNYANCREDQDKLEALQAIVRTVIEAPVK